MALPKKTFLPPPENQSFDKLANSTENKKEKASLLNPSPSSPKNQGVSFFKKNKTITIALSLILALAAIGGGVYLVQQRVAIKPKAAPEDVPPCAGMSTTRCWGECQPGTCKEYEVCELAAGGFCQNRKINDNSPSCGAGCGGSGGGSQPTQAQTQKCSPEAPGQENSWCVSRHSGETKENATWSCEPNSPDAGSDGCLQICKAGYVWEMPSYSRCVSSGTGSGRLTCRRNSNTSITLINTTNQSIAYEVLEFRNCPYSSATCQGDQYRKKYAQPTILAGQSITESIAAAHCETTQLDIRSLNSSFPCFSQNGQMWDGGVAFAIDHHWDQSCEPTSTPTKIPTATPIPTQPPPTATPIPYSCNCTQIKLYDLSWQSLSPENISAGQTIYIAVAGSEAYPQYQFDKGRIRINESAWKPSHETTNLVPQKDNEFYITYTIPPEGGRLVIEGEIHLNATIPDPEETDWWR